jgi:hypothetical protein
MYQEKNGRKVYNAYPCTITPNPLFLEEESEISGYFPLLKEGVRGCVLLTSNFF